ncbi:MAG: hypothetical protein DRO06_03250 [Thermoproteota archaeon]|nr:MAG: hypothetical protein DRO06_03250 [Candidatus Korarchaeota archaeon]
MRLSDLLGKEVVTSDGFKLGKVEDLLVDEEGWKVTDLVVSLTRQSAKAVGLRKILGSVKVALPVETASGIGDVVTLSKPIEEVKPELRPV